MATPYFQFQQFTVWHDRCGMKVGTDGVLLGAWCNVEGAASALDVGTGSGVIALMLAQRNEVLKVVGIDIDRQAVEQARQNFRQSPFADRLTALRHDFRQPMGEGNFDLLVSNPPFFVEDTPSPDRQRQMARSAEALPFGVLARHAARLLTEEGRLAVVVPHVLAADCVLAASAEGLRLCRRLDVRGSERKPPKRSLLEFSRQNATATMGLLTIGSPDYDALVSQFYLRKDDARHQRQHPSAPENFV